MTKRHGQIFYLLLVSFLGSGCGEGDTCPRLPNPLHGQMVKVDETHLKVECDEGYVYSEPESITRTCLENGTWSGVEGSCREILCKPIADVPHGHVIQSYGTYRSIATIICDTGYRYSHPDSTNRTCLGHDTWSGQDGTCKAVQCPKLTNPDNGVFVEINRSYLGKATIQCNEGYKYNQPNDITRTCTGDNTWSGEQGQCEGVRCPDLPDVDHGKLSAPGGKYKDKVLLQCPSAYILEGRTLTTCRANGTWSAALGKCRFPQQMSGLLIGIIMGISILLLTLVIVAVLVWIKMFKKRTGETDDRGPLLEKLLCHFCSFNLKEAAEVPVRSIIKEITRRLEEKLHVKVEVEVTYIFKRKRTVFMKIKCDTPVSQENMANALGGPTIQGPENAPDQGQSYHVIPDSIVFRDEVKHLLVADIKTKSHIKDKASDEKIDLDTEYVRLRLVSGKRAAARRRGKLNLRPDLYQYGLEQEQLGKDVQEQDLITGEDTQKYILIRGRAGIGKSTLLQSLIWRWAKGDFATQFKAIFMLNLRHLMLINERTDLAHLCCRSVYNTGEQNQVINAKWLSENQGKVAFVLDGIDEIMNFKDKWGKSSQKSPEEKAKPLDWCFALMERKILPGCTIIASSRPFADLALIEKHIEKHVDSELRSDQLMPVELMGLTRERVLEFVAKRFQEETRREFVTKALQDNPILMSVCSITFFCAALCRILGDGNQNAPKLITYTQITAYILQMFMERAMKTEGQPALDESSVQKALDYLSRLALDGFSHCFSTTNPDEPPRLVFRKEDLDKLNPNDSERANIRKLGLLVENEDGSDEFIHLSVQEMLAMVELTNRSPDEFRDFVKKLTGSEQFNMTLWFLYGLVFDSDNEFVRKLSTATRASSEIHDELEENLKEVHDMQGLQIAHESQWSKIAEMVGDSLFTEEAVMEGTKLTVIEIKALIFMLQNHKRTNIVKLMDVGLDVASASEIRQFLEQDVSSSLKEIELHDNEIDEDCIEMIQRWLEINKTLETFTLNSKKISDKSLTEIAASLKKNTSLKTLVLTLTKANVSAKGVRALADGIKENKSLRKLTLILPIASMTEKGAASLGDMLLHNETLTTLSLSSGHITDEGVKSLVKPLTTNKILQHLGLLGFQIKENGGTAILEALKVNNGIEVRIEPPACSEQTQERLENHPQIEIS